MLCLSTPLEAASNREEVAAFEKRKQQAADDKIPFKEEPVYLKVSLEVMIPAILFFLPPFSLFTLYPLSY